LFSGDVFQGAIFSTNSLMVERIANMNVMHGVDDFRIAIQAVFIQCNCVLRMLLEIFRVIVRFTWGNVG